MLRVFVCMVGMLVPMTALGATGTLECVLNADKSALEVIASNPSDTSYYCQAWCRMKVTGERPVQRFDCTFNLGKNAAEKVVCKKDGGAPKFFSEVLPTRSTCVPR